MESIIEEQRKCHLLALPFDIRELIWEMAITEKDTLFPHLPPYQFGSSLEFTLFDPITGRGARSFLTALQLATVCRLVCK